MNAEVSKAGASGAAWPITVYLRADPAALDRVVGLLRRRGGTIERLSYSRAGAGGCSRADVLVRATDGERLLRQLRRLVDVVEAKLAGLAEG